MTDDTLSPVGFDTGPIVKTRLDAQTRFAMACAYGDRVDGSPEAPQAAFLRRVILLGVEQLGWTEERMIKEYADYRVRCIRAGEHNPYESE